MHIVKETPRLRTATLIAGSAFVQPVTTALEQDVKVHLEEGHLVYSLFIGSTLVGFAVFNVWEDILYLSGIVITAKYQGNEAVRKSVNAAVSDAPAVRFLSLRTQNPRLWVAFSRVTTNHYPHMSGAETSDKLREVGERVAGQIGSAFPVGHGHYGGPLYGEKPTHSDKAVQAHWDNICDYDRGDAVICVGTLPTG